MKAAGRPVADFVRGPKGTPLKLAWPGLGGSLKHGPKLGRDWRSSRLSPLRDFGPARRATIRLRGWSDNMMLKAIGIG
jgi:hypothetical protein